MPQTSTLPKTAVETYDLCLGPVMFREPAERMARIVASYRPQHLLETAAGTGLVTQAVLDQVPAVRAYIATDLNPAALGVAQGKVAGRENVTLEVADAQALAYASDSFDMVLCQFGMMLFPNKERAYAEARRVLKPGGRYLFSVWDSVFRNPFAGVLIRTIEETFGANPPAYFNLPYAYHQIDAIRTSLQDCGFGEIMATVHRTVSPISDPEGFATGFVHRPDFVAEVNARGGDLAVIQQALAQAFARELRGQTALQYIFIEAVAV